MDLKDQKIQTLKTIAQCFILNDLKISKMEYENTNIGEIWQEERDDCDIINIMFKSKQDI